MKIDALPVMLTAAIFFTCLASFACQPATPPTNRESANANANVTPEKVDPIAIEAELTRLERGWADAGKNHDANAASLILADDLIITYPDGTTGTKADELKVISSGSITADSWELFDPKVTVLSPDAAVITGRTVMKNGKYKEPNRKALDISGEYRFTDVYVRRNGKWQALASHTTKIANPTPAASPSPAIPPPPTPKASATTAGSPAATP